MCSPVIDFSHIIGMLKIDENSSKYFFRDNRVRLFSTSPEKQTPSRLKTLAHLSPFRNPGNRNEDGKKCVPVLQSGPSEPKLRLVPNPEIDYCYIG